MIGILALQGGFDAHRKVLQGLGVATQLVRSADELAQCAALVIPGGESTTISDLLRREQLTEPLKHFAAERPLFGTCAGAVLMARSGGDHRVEHLAIIDVEVARNAYGTQVDSFEQPVEMAFDPDRPMAGVFIRAPKLSRFGAVDVVATCNGEVVAIRQGKHLVTTFHPELSDDGRLHSHFLESVYGDTRVIDQPLSALI